MATTDSTSHLDKAYLEEVSDYLPQYKTELNGCKNADAGIFQRDRLMEFASITASKGLYVKESGPYQDFSDESDFKSQTINYRPSHVDKSGNGQVSIDGVKGKKFLRAMCWDPIVETFSYYVIWSWKETLDRIEFRHNAGKSKYTNGVCGLEVDSFDELATFDFSKVC